MLGAPVVLGAALVIGTAPVLGVAVTMGVPSALDTSPLLDVPPALGAVCAAHARGSAPHTAAVHFCEQIMRIAYSAAKSWVYPAECWVCPAEIRGVREEAWRGNSWVDYQVAKQLARTVRSRRKQLGLTQDELARRAELDRTTVQALEAGKSDLKNNRNANPKTQTLLHLAEALQMPIGDLLAGAETSFAKRPDRREPHMY